MKRSRWSHSGSSTARPLLIGVLIAYCSTIILAAQRPPINSVGGHELRGVEYLPALECYDPYGRPQVRGRNLPALFVHKPIEENWELAVGHSAFGLGQFEREMQIN